MAWRKPGILVLGQRNQQTMGMAEMIIKANGCVVQMGLSEDKKEYFVLRKGRVLLSPHLDSLGTLCAWVISNQDEILRRLNDAQEENTNSI